MKPKLTPAQKKLLESIIDESTDIWLEIFPNESRTAYALERKGYIEYDGSWATLKKEAP